MKVKVSELKTHLSRYLKHLDDDGPIEVCLREETVAYLVSALASNPASQQALADKVRSAGLLLHQASRRQAPETLPVAHVAGDGRVDISTVESIRGERDY